MIAEVAAQISEPTQWVAPLTSAGIVAVLIKWMTGRFDANLRDITQGLRAVEASNNRQTRALLMLVLGMDKSAATKREIGVITTEIEKDEKGEPK